MQVTYEALMKTIAENYPEVYPDNLPFVFPPWVQFVEEIWNMDQGAVVCSGQLGRIHGFEMHELQK